MIMIGLYSKALTSALVAVLVSIIAVRGVETDGGATVTGPETLTVLIAGLVALGAVWAVKQTALSGIAKAVTSCLIAGLSYLVGTDWPPDLNSILAAVVAAIAALGITYVVPNAPRSVPPA